MRETELPMCIADFMEKSDLIFTDELPLSEIDCLFFCTAHGDTRKFLETHTLPDELRVVDLSMDFRIESDEHDFGVWSSRVES